MFEQLPLVLQGRSWYSVLVSAFHTALAAAVRQLDGDADLVASLSVERCADVIEEVLSSIARIDFIVVQDSSLNPPMYVDILSVWVAAGAPEGVGAVLRVLYRRNKMALEDVRAIFASGVSADYLNGCLDAGISRTETICTGWEAGLPLDYLAAMQ